MNWRLVLLVVAPLIFVVNLVVRLAIAEREDLLGMRIDVQMLRLLLVGLVRRLIHLSWVVDLVVEAGREGEPVMISKAALRVEAAQEVGLAMTLTAGLVVLKAGKMVEGAALMMERNLLEEGEAVLMMARSFAVREAEEVRKMDLMSKVMAAEAVLMVQGSMKKAVTAEGRAAEHYC
jgi:hypothetical protein